MNTFKTLVIILLSFLCIFVLGDIYLFMLPDSQKLQDMWKRSHVVCSQFRMLKHPSCGGNLCGVCFGTDPKRGNAMIFPDYETSGVLILIPEESYTP